jgi:hypothetical protein
MKSDQGAMNPLIGVAPRDSAAAATETKSGKAKEVTPLARPSGAAADACSQLNQGQKPETKQQEKQVA